MTPTGKGSIHLFRFAGIDIFLHWSWFVIALYEINNRTNSYSSFTWNVLEYVGLFVIVLMHECGHSLACRQVGGQANEIVLWPLGGVAYVSPPPRPGAMLWSIAAGPLVNVLLVPILAILLALFRSSGWVDAMPNMYQFIGALWFVNLALLIFNILPIYPLDGGQILRSLLWFVLGPARSLMAASVIGLLGVAVLLGLSLLQQSSWMIIMSVFILMNCWQGLGQARAMARVAARPCHSGYACPDCQNAPPAGAFWLCGNCRQPFDTFETRAVCPHCGSRYDETTCVNCGRKNPMSDWIQSGG